jgi:hypothetical protein
MIWLLGNCGQFFILQIHFMSTCSLATVHSYGGLYEASEPIGKGQMHEHCADQLLSAIEGGRGK